MWKFLSLWLLLLCGFWVTAETQAAYCPWERELVYPYLTSGHYQADCQAGDAPTVATHLLDRVATMHTRRRLEPLEYGENEEASPNETGAGESESDSDSTTDEAPSLYTTIAEDSLLTPRALSQKAADHLRQTHLCLELVCTEAFLQCRGSGRATTNALTDRVDYCTEAVDRTMTVLQRQTERVVQHNVTVSKAQAFTQQTQQETLRRYEVFILETLTELVRLAGAFGTSITNFAKSVI